MGMKIHFKIQKIDQILPVFWKLFEKLDKWYTRVQFFSAYFLKRWHKVLRIVGGGRGGGGWGGGGGVQKKFLLISWKF